MQVCNEIAQMIQHSIPPNHQSICTFADLHIPHYFNFPNPSAILFTPSASFSMLLA
ncbi:hypothetical protein SAMN04488505_104208 [Chitinophaga rupis]|uniref:Uncharacterized protein n=1 Tax=Chitinophaga rupis TaxID=573321 RepID=A0A1H7XVJ6_9BACT|nr:hypothetical protein SAMN04488505_104208 [Chitinophaga rupis]